VRCKATDLYPLPSSRQILSDGALAAPARIGRTGIQVYSARELGLDGGDKPIRLMRTAEEVAKAIASFESRTVTDDHPLRDVDPTTWSLVAKGDVRDVAMSGEFMASTIIVRDGPMIDKVRDGKAELSCGYSFDLDLTPGVDSTGARFDGYQRNITGNHVAIVDAGRAGSQVRIADRDPNRSRTMKTRISTKDHKITDKLTVPGTTITIEADEAVVAQVQDAFDRHDRGMKDCKDAYDSKAAEVAVHKERADSAEKAMRDAAKEMGAESDEDGDEDETDDSKKAGDVLKLAAKVVAIGKAKDEKIKALEARVTDAAIEKLGEERAKVVTDAAALLGEDFDAKGKTIAQIRTAALDAALKDDGLKGVVQAILGETEPSKAKAEDAVKAFGAVVALGARTPADDSQDFKLSGMLIGDSDAERARSTVNTRDAFYAREAEMSRRPPSGRSYARDSSPSGVQD
jgi:uncharacterized protein